MPNLKPIIFASLAFVALTPLASTSRATAAPAPLQSQTWAGPRYMRQAIDEVVEAAVQASRTTKYGLDQGTSVFGALVQKGKTISFQRTLTAGRTYIFAAGGDRDVRDVDIALTDASGNKVKEDDTDKQSAFISYKPATTGKYKFTVSLYDAVKQSFIAAVILSDQGWNVPIGNLRTATTKILENCEKIGASNRVVFQDASNQWALFGGVIEPGKTQIVDNVVLAAGQYSIAAACDDQSDDIDLWLTKNRAPIASDEDVDANPLISADVTAGAHTLKIKNSGSAPSLGIMVIMRASR